MTSWSGSSRSTASLRRVSAPVWATSTVGVTGAAEPPGNSGSCSPRVTAPRQPHREAWLHLPPQRPPQPGAAGGRVTLPLPGMAPLAARALPQHWAPPPSAQHRSTPQHCTSASPPTSTDPLFLDQHQVAGHGAGLR